MAAKVLHRSLQNSKIFDEFLIIEMDKCVPTKKDLTFKTDIIQVIFLVCMKQMNVLIISDDCRAKSPFTVKRLTQDISVEMGVPRQKPKDISYNLTETPEKPPFQGSLASLESRSLADVTEVQPLTLNHICRYDECYKFRQNKLTKEQSESPVSPLKSFFLILVIILLMLWIIIYTLLTQLGIL